MRKVAVLGGGCGAMAAAFELTQEPGWRTKYEITVYQLGWRIGGKGASGRNPDADERIEEHGLHVWGGFYDDAFRVMNTCYEHLGREKGAPLSTVEKAFHPQNRITWMEDVDGEWRRWDLDFPGNELKPGTGHPGLSIWQHVGMTIKWLLLEAKKLRPHGAAPAAAAGIGASHWIHDLLDRHGVDPAAEKAPADHPAFWASLAHRLASALHPHASHHASDDHKGLLWLLEELLKWLEKYAEKELLKDDVIRRAYILMNLGGACAKGILKDGVLKKGWSSIDHLEWREWLKSHGASDFTLQSAPVRGAYDFIFAYEHGDPDRPRVAAGVCTQSLARLVFDYKGAIFFKMCAGMGDTVFTPLYQYLKDQGVKFEFFHRVKNLGLSEGEKSVSKIAMGRQVTLLVDEYDPLVTVEDLPCWPSAPRYWTERDGERVQQIREAEQLQAEHIDLESAWTKWKDVEELELVRGRDFDDVVLGISLAALPDVCPELIAASDAWKNMTGKIGTVQTQAAQLWLDCKREKLGWDFSTILTAYAHPLETWSDMTQVLDREKWPKGEKPKNIGYFCGPLPDPASIPPFTDHAFPQAMTDAAKANAVKFLDANATGIWPGSAEANGPGFDWGLVADPGSNESGAKRFDSQYWRANVNPTERYVISLPDTTQFRLGSGDSGFGNLFLAGDWVRTSLNFGCVEAAVEGGLGAARALRDSEPARVRTKGQYVERSGQQCYCQPLALEDTRFSGFVVDADAKALQAMCDRYLNEPAGGAVSYHPLAARAMLGFAHAARAHSTMPPDSDMGCMQEIDVAFWVPVARVKRKGSIDVVEKILWFLPYVFVNNAWAMVSGREIYGFAKEIGEFRMPEKPGDPGPYTADTLVLPQFSSHTPPQMKRLVEVTKVGEGGGSPAADWADLKEAAEMIWRLVVGTDGHLEIPGLGLIVQLWDLVAHHELPLVFLKQFRNVADGRRADAQAIVEAPAQVTSFRGAGNLLGDWKMKIETYDSHPIVSDLGLVGPEPTVRAAWWADFDMVMEAGTEVWKA